jgi:hypothetical protein
MGASNMTRCDEERKGLGGCSCQPLCPVCSGPLVPLRGNYRCGRCFFSLCVGCEAVEAVVPAGVED